MKYNLSMKSNPDSEAAYDGGISGNRHSSLPEKVRRCRIPMRQKPGESGVLPRTVQPNSVSDIKSVTGSSSEDNRNSRPVRAIRKPNWMRSKGWVLG